jgi:release factor glutamine methyltransferase
MYKGKLDKDLEKNIRIKHEKVLKLISNHKGRYNLLGFKINVQKKAFPPCPDSVVFANFLSKLDKVDSALDMGTGSGILALVLSKKAKKVLAVDINPYAIASLKENIVLNKIDNIEVKKSNVFSNVKGKFDIIVFNPPFRYFKPGSLLEMAMTDHNYKSLTLFFKNAKKHLNKKGKIYLIFSNSGDIIYLESLIKGAGFSFKIIKKVYSQLLGWDIKALKNYYILYEIK